MAGGCIKDAPSPTILCFSPSCHGRRIGQDRPGRLKLQVGSLVLPPAMCKTHPRALKSGAYFGGPGAPKLTPLTNFAMLPYRGECVPCATKLAQTSTICRKRAVIKSVHQ